MEAKLLELCTGKTVMLAGCGGGYDCFGSLLIYHQIRAHAKKVLFANLSFTADHVLQQAGTRVSMDCFKLAPYKDAEKLKEDAQMYGHFAEAFMATYVKEHVYCFRHNATVGGITTAYEDILRHEGLSPRPTSSSPPKPAAEKEKEQERTFLDTLLDEEGPAEKEKSQPALDVLFLVDGGCDALLTGDESGGLGTPREDMMHVRAVQMLPPGLIGQKFVAAIGANIDLAHGVWQEDLDERLANLCQTQKASTFEPFLFSDKHPAAKYFMDGVRASVPSRTIVQSLVVAALEGHGGVFTPEHLVPRIRESVIDLTDQTATLFCFDFDAIASQVQYLPQLDAETSPDSFEQELDKYQWSKSRQNDRDVSL